MATNNKVFEREFKTMMVNRKARNSNFSITQIDLPDVKYLSQKGLVTKDDFVSGGKWGYVKNIAEPYFSDLNKHEVEIIKGRSFEKKIPYYDKNNKIQYMKDRTGQLVTETINVEKGFVAVYSDVNIHLPNKIEKNGTKRDYEPTYGYNFIESVNTAKGKKYLYTIPMECVYPVELCALVIALNRHKAYYKGCRVALTNGHYVYVYSIPYKYRENQGYIMVGAKTNPDFGNEIHKLLEFWMNKGILFDLNLTAIPNDFGDMKNLGIEDIPGTCMYEDYQKIGSALKEMDLETLEESVENE